MTILTVSLLGMQRGSTTSWRLSNARRASGKAVGRREQGKLAGRKTQSPVSEGTVCVPLRIALSMLELRGEGGAGWWGGSEGPTPAPTAQTLAFLRAAPSPPARPQDRLEG